MANRGGYRPGSGKKKGVPNRKTIERRAEAARAKAQAELLQAVRVGDVVGQIEAAKAVNKRLGKDILEDFANVLAGMAAHYQPRDGNQHADEKKFRYYTELAIYAADKLAPFQSPRLAAVMVGQAQTKTIVVKGGLPEFDSAPAPLPEPEDHIGQPERRGDDKPADVSPASGGLPLRSGAG